MRNVIRTLLACLVCGAATFIQASTITISPTSQTINVGQSTTVNVGISGLSRDQALGAFNLLVMNNASIIRPTGATFGTSLGDPMMQLMDASLTNSSATLAEVSFESTATLLGLQLGQPFTLFQLSYLGVGAGTSLLSFGTSPLVLADGSGNILPTPLLNTASITVVDGTTPPPVPEPSTLVLLGTGSSMLMAFARRTRGTWSRRA